jgi:hypothetical protein
MDGLATRRTGTDSGSSRSFSAETKGAVRSRRQGGRSCNGKDAHDLNAGLGRGEQYFAKFGIGGPLAGVQHRGRLARQGETVLRAGN